MAKLWLGTAQFGLDYGVSNTAGRIGRDEAARILDHAAAVGVDTLDTAPAYGTSEDVLGALDAARRFRLVTKTPQFRSDVLTAAQADQAAASLDASLTKLRADRLNGLLVHWTGDLLVPGGERLYRVLDAAKRDGRLERIGISVYDPPEIAAVAERYPIDFVQIPLNVFDQRFLRGDLLTWCAERGILVHSRSAFLQGLLLMDARSLPQRFKGAEAKLAAFGRAAQRQGLSALEAALSVPGHAPLEAVLCGVTSLKEFEEIAANFERSRSMPFDAADFDVDDPAIIDPRRWT
jgi:aryl-alcohol dehydrogenase-like predicted oxidoreductase